MFSVTSEAAASVSFQSAPPQSCAARPVAGNDSFGALVDSNTATDTGNIAPPRRRRNPHRSAAPTTRRQPPKHGGSRERRVRRPGSQNDSDDSNVSRADRLPTASAAPTPTLGGPAVQGEVRQPRKPAPRNQPKSRRPATTSAADPTAPAQQGGSPRRRRTPVAVAIPVTVALTDAPCCTAGLRQCHGAVGHRGGGHRSQHAPGRRRTGWLRRRRSRSIPDAAALSRPQSPRLLLRRRRYRGDSRRPRLQAAASRKTAPRR